MQNQHDMNLVTDMGWDFIAGTDIIIIKLLLKGELVNEDPLQAIPQRVSISNLPRMMWTKEVIKRIMSALGRPLSTWKLTTYLGSMHNHRCRLSIP